jgi:acyl-CoA synthetase (AMP-forming)/AMP-acid ligase II
MRLSLSSRKFFCCKCPQVFTETLGFREFKYDTNNEAALAKELVLQVRKVIGPFAAPKKIIIVGDLPKTRSGKVNRFFPSLEGQRWLMCFCG